MYTYSYDADGNRTKEDHYYFTVGELCESAFRRGYTYTYTSDRLMQRTYRSISGTGATTSCTYDQMGNPTTYFDRPITWARGRLLASYGNTTFRYNGEGIRFKKGSIEYILDGERIIAEKKNGTVTKRYFYDGSGIAGMWYDGAEYVFRKNIQGDVIAIYNGGTQVATYAYDAWGRILSSSGNMASVNPFRYRGYYFDTETGLYYLNSRYYDPVTGRFISPDTYSYLDPETVNGLNLYAYALNNPVMYCDPSGHDAEWILNVLLGIGILLGTALFVFSIVASAGAVGALAGVGAAALGFSSGAVSAIATVATISTYVVAGGVALFGLSDSVEAFSNGINPIRDYIMGGNQTAYDITHGIFDALGTIAVIAGTFGPKILQDVAKKYGTPKFNKAGDIVGYSLDFGNKSWSARIDATIHGNPKYHHNPHVHFGDRGGHGKGVYYFWEVIRRILGF